MQRSERFIKLTWWLTACTVVIYCLFRLFYWDLPSGTRLFPWLAVLVVVPGVVFPAVVLPFRRWRTHPVASLVPLGFCIACFIISPLVNFRALSLAANFKFHRVDRAEIVRRIATGELRPNVSDDESLIALPKEFAHVSRDDGEVMIQRDGGQLKILFFISRGWGGRFGGIAHTSDGSPPGYDDFGGISITDLRGLSTGRAIEEGWFLVWSRD